MMDRIERRAIDNKIPPPPPPPPRFGSVRARLTPLVGAVFGAGLLFFTTLPHGPAHAAVTCDTNWQRGTLQDNGIWAVDGAGTDYRVACTGDANGDTLNIDDLPESPAGAARLVVDVSVSNQNIDFVRDGLTNAEDEHVVVTGALGASGGDDGGVHIDVDSFQDNQNAFTLESFADIHASGDSTRGIWIRNRDPEHKDHVVAINHGTITTSGDDWAYGMYVETESTASEAHARAVNKGTISTSGIGARGVRAKVESTGAGTATVINEGTITTSGGVKMWTEGTESGWTGAHGMFAQNDGGGDAHATNEAGGVIEITGEGARGVYAGAGFSVLGTAGNGGTAVAINRGTVTATGDSAAESDGTLRYSASGVYAHSLGGVARAVNEAGGSVTTGSKDENGVRSGGARSRGVYAGNEGDAGEARAVNRGSVTTYGDPLPGEATASDGVNAWSVTQSAYAENSGEVRTEGRNASGVEAAAGGGGAGEEAVAVNSGEIVTTGGRDADGSAAGVFAYTGGGAAATATNEARGSIDVSGDGVRGILIFANNNRVQDSTSGDALAENAGSIVTRGNAHRVADGWRGPFGILSWSADGTATARNSGTIETHGVAAYGVLATSDNGDAVVENSGSVVTLATEADSTLPGSGGLAIGSRGLYAHSDTGDATVVNEAAGRVETSGARAFGLFCRYRR